MEEEFSLEEFLKKGESTAHRGVNYGEFEFDELCNMVKREIDREWETADEEGKNRRLRREKAAIMGSREATGYYKEKIKEILREKKLEKRKCPEWYPDLVEGIFAELYGLAGLAPWAYDMDPKYINSSSAKIIGNNLFCLINGVSVLQPQKISEKRRIQLKRALLMATPKERIEYGFHEVYLHNGIRITIYSGSRTKEGQDVMVFRKYVLRDLTFEKIAEMGTIPFEAINLFKEMIKTGFNVIFAGQVRSGKTTFMQIWQSLENTQLEGLAIATDPETPWHDIMPEAPVMQLVADGEELEVMMKSLLRGDNDYVLLEEMRDAVAYKLALDITSAGTMRSKATIHDSDAVNIPYKMACKIGEKYGGDVNATISQIYKNFDYIFEFTQDRTNRGKKILKGITELYYDHRGNNIYAHRICIYDFKQDVWMWDDYFAEENINKIPEYGDECKKISEELKKLNFTSPLKEKIVFSPAYYKRR